MKEFAPREQILLFKSWLLVRMEAKNEIRIAFQFTLMFRLLVQPKTVTVLKIEQVYISARDYRIIYKKMGHPK